MQTQEMHKLNRLLSGEPGPSIQEKEEMLRSILEQVCPAEEGAARGKRRGWSGVWSWRWSLAGGALAATLALLVVYGVPRYLGTGNDEFVSRGGGSQKGLFKMVCVATHPDGAQISPRPGSSCRRGDTLVFRLRPGADERYFSAAALGPNGLLIWYFPSETRASLFIAEGGVSQHGIVLDVTHPAGRYRVFGVFSPEPLSREVLRATFEDHAASRSQERDVSEEGMEVVDP